MLIRFFIWPAENLGTFFDVWRYPNQIGAWATLHIDKWSSWSLLAMMTFTIVTNLKHVKKMILAVHTSPRLPCQKKGGVSACALGTHGCAARAKVAQNPTV